MLGRKTERKAPAIVTGPDVNVIEREIGIEDRLGDERGFAAVGYGGKCRGAIVGDFESPEVQGRDTVVVGGRFAERVAGEPNGDGVDQPVGARLFGQIAHSWRVDEVEIEAMPVALHIAPELLKVGPKLGGFR